MAVAVDTGELKRHFEEAKAGRAPVEGAWDQIEQYVLPLGASGRDQGGEAGVRWKRAEVWDSTAIDGCQRFAASIHSSVTSPAIRWFKFGFRDQKLNQDTEAMKWLDQVTEVVWSDLQESDFNQEIATAYQEFVGYGNLALAVEAVEPDYSKPWRGLDFTAPAIRECYPQPDTQRGILRFFRELRWTPAQIKDRFQDSKRPLPATIMAKAETPEGAREQLSVVWAVFKRPGVAKAFPAAPELRPYGYVYFLAETGEQLGDEGGYFDEQTFHGRWERTAGSDWGHGPANVMLPTIIYLNKLLEVQKAAMEKAVDPATLVTEFGLLSDLNLEPGQYTVVRSMDDIKVHESGARFDVAQESISELRAMVRQAFHVDDLQLKDSPAMTATEAQIRYELMSRVLGSTLARLTAEVLGPLLQAVLGIEFRAGRLPKMPDQVKQAGGESMIQYLGPLSRSQRTDEVAAAERFLSAVAALMKTGFVLAGDLVDVDGFLRSMAERLGVPAQLLREQGEVDRIRRERAAMQQRAAEAEIAKVQADAAASRASAGPEPAQPEPLVAPTLEAA